MTKPTPDRTFLAAQIPSMPPEAQAQMTQMGPVIRGQISAMPATIKARVLEAAAAEAAAETVETSQ